ncbi:MAG: acyl-CoA thioesterase [Pseudohongiella sp.]|uniref:acyl-CoA thioesterase n=1 Tax=Pseudohongiella sp. TaxID=1979412 RepID=UPI0034A0771E
MTLFQHAMEVRDYECDLQGVVNNAVYQNYLEHARHEFLKTRGLDFARLTADGVIVVVVRAEIDYLASLRSGDRFHVSVEPTRESRIRLAFLQEIRRAGSDELIVKARIITTAVNARGRPYLPAMLDVLLD